MNLTADDILQMIQQSVTDWHEKEKRRPADHEIVTDRIRKIRPLNEYRQDIDEIIRELAETNSEIWHEEDKVRSENDATVLRAVRNINPLNQHRNDLIEEIDECILGKVSMK